MSKNLLVSPCPLSNSACTTPFDRRRRPVFRWGRSSVVRARRVLATLTLAALLGGGCGGDDCPYPNTNVGGDVTINRIPVKEGFISFQSLDPNNGHFADARIVRGRYIAENVPLGKVLVV